MATASNRRPNDSIDGDLVRRLDWSEPVDGIRGAVYVHLTKNTPSNMSYRISLAIQNVSSRAIRWVDRAGDGNQRTLYLHRSAEILMGLSQPQASTLELVLEPQEIYLLDFLQGVERADAIHHDLCEGLLKFPSQSLSIQWEVHSVPEGAWKGIMRTPISRGAIGVVGAVPQSTEARQLFDAMMCDVRVDGAVPNGWLQLLGQTTRQFIQNNTGDKSGDASARRMQALVTRLDRKTDWQQSEVVSLLDEIANVSTIPIELSLEWIRERSFQRGSPLPEIYRDVSWGAPVPSGLRMAWTFEPRSDAYPIDTSLRSVVLLHNAGREPIAFATRSFHQPSHVALGGLGELIATESIFWTTRGRPESYRLHPGEFCEVHAPGIRIGPRDADGNDWSSVRVGTYLLAQPGERVALEPGEIMLEASKQEGLSKDWWPTTVRERLARIEPLPNNAQDRELVLFRAVEDLFGTSPQSKEWESFVADQSSEALDHLAEVLANRSGMQITNGSIQPGVVNFRVLEADPNAATKPRMASNPGRYALAQNLVLVVSRRSEGIRIVNEASLVRQQDRVEAVSIKVPLPDGYDSWAAGWQPGTTVLWVAQPGMVRGYDFSDAAKIKTAEHNATLEDVSMPDEMKEALRPVLDKISSPEENSMPPAASSPAAGTKKSTTSEVPTQHDELKSLIQIWRHRARLNGEIPGGSLSVLLAEIDRYIEQFADEEQAATLKALRSKLDPNRDWNEKELVALIEPIADVSVAPIAWAQLKVTLGDMQDVRRGAPLPDEWKNAAWGAPAENGLRTAWVLEDQPKEVHVGDVLKSRVLFINGGTKTIYLQTDTWRQHDTHEALDGENRPIKIDPLRFTGITPSANVCLRPGEFAEVAGHGIGIGGGAFEEEIGQGRVGAMIRAKAGDTIKFSTSMHFVGNAWRQARDAGNPATRFRRNVAGRVALYLPIPPSSGPNAEERRHLLIQITQELFGEAPTVDELNAFLNDASEHPEEALIDRLAIRKEPEFFEGELKTGVQTLRVLPEVPKDATEVRIATRPGRYALRDGAHLQVSQTTTGNSRTNQATLVVDASGDVPRRETAIALPDGLDAYAILWTIESEELYVVERGRVRRIRIRDGVLMEESIDATRLPETFRDRVPEKLK